MTRDVLMAAVEYAATLLGIACVVFAARRSILTFPAGIASVSLVGWLVWDARLYSDALLQLFFVGANLYGWAVWRRAASGAGDVPVRAMGAAMRARWAVGTVGLAVATGGLMHRFTDASYPWWDAGIAAASMAAQLLLARRYLENWWLWVAVNVASVPLYLAKGLGVLAALYLVYLGLALWGLLDWHRAAGPRRDVAVA